MSASIDTLAGPNGLRFVQIEYRSPASMPDHTHDAEATINYCLAGNLIERRDGREFSQQAGDLSVIPAGTPHANRFPTGARVFLVVLEARWRERVRLATEVLESEPRAARGGASSWIAAHLHREFLRRDPLSALALEGLALELVAELAREFSEGDAPRWLQQTIDFLHDHFAESLTADAIADASGVHPAHLMRAFRQRHRCTVGEYVRRLRVERARHLLETSETPLAEIAVVTGFCDQAHLGRAFKERTGLTPGQFRRAYGRTRAVQAMQL